MRSITVDIAGIDAALPMALVFDADGIVRHVAPTLDRIAPGMRDRPLHDCLRVPHPTLQVGAAGILARAGRRLKVELTGESGGAASPLRGIAVPLAGGAGLLNLTFGADARRAVARHGLTAQDFSPVDPTIEMLFLSEANGIVLTEFREMSQRLEEARGIAEEEAATDKLTGLRNRRAMDLHLERLTQKRDAPFGLMHLDLDYFKSINDTLGHAAGDRVLEEVAHILRDEVRRSDMIARVGGDEFTLVFEDCRDVERLERIAMRIIARLERPIDWRGHACSISGSIGITLSSYYDDPDPARLTRDADAALYVSKRGGRARHSVATPPGRVAAAE